MDRERKKAASWEIESSLQCTFTPEVDLHGPAMMLESKGCLCITGTNHLKVLGQKLLGLHYFLQDVFPLIQIFSLARPLEVEK